jgi:hypothetical protein
MQLYVTERDSVQGTQADANGMGSTPGPVVNGKEVPGQTSFVDITRVRRGLTNLLNQNEVQSGNLKLKGEDDKLTGALGEVITHEIGHQLLGKGTDDHKEGTIMKAGLTPNDLKHPEDLQFDADQSAEILKRLLEQP